MVTSVKLTEKAKRTLDRLHAQLFLASGKELTKQELLEWAIEQAAEEKDRLLLKATGVRYPLSKKAKERLRKIPMDWGIETDEESIDEAVYGGKLP